MADRDLVLTASLRPAALDARRGIVRLHPEVLGALNLRPGDPVRLTGRRTTAGIVAPGEQTDGRGLLHADDLMLGNLGVRDGAQVTVSPTPVVAARRATLRGAPGVVAVVSPEMLRLAHDDAQPFLAFGAVWRMLVIAMAATRVVCRSRCDQHTRVGAIDIRQFSQPFPGSQPD